MPFLIPFSNRTTNHIENIMANEELDKLRAALAEKGITAPKSWNENKLKKELAKAEEAEANSKKESSTDESTSSEDENNLNESNSEQENSEQSTSEDNSSDDSDESTDDSTEQEPTDTENTDNEDESGDDEVLDDNVKLKAKTAFSNSRLKLEGIKSGQTLTVSPQDAKFLVETDRTCEYVND